MNAGQEGTTVLRTKYARWGSVLWLASLLLAAIAWGETVELLGAGATFPYPLYARMFAAYAEQTGVRVNYQPIGSGGGIRQLRARTIDFGATDAFMSDEELGKVPATILHVPICLGAVAVTYSLPGSPVLRLTGEVLADIFMGLVTEWNDPKIVRLNPSIKLPVSKIAIIHRSDGSGTTSIFTDYLSRVSERWREQVGHGKSVKWPTGLGAKGNEGVMGLVKQVKGSIGYCELTYAMHNDMPQALLRNRAGRFVLPTIASISAAADVAYPEDTRISITDTDAPLGYPMAGFTWVILYREQSYGTRNGTKARELAKLLWWMVHQGQRYVAPLEYAPLPEKAIRRAEAILRMVTHDGQRLIEQ